MKSLGYILLLSYSFIHGADDYARFRLFLWEFNYLQDKESTGNEQILKALHDFVSKKDSIKQKTFISKYLSLHGYQKWKFWHSCCYSNKKYTLTQEAIALSGYLNQKGVFIFDGN